MRAKPSERERLIKLRSAARAVRGKYGPLVSDMHLSLAIHCFAQRIATIGDLDHFITRVCDGLMAATSRRPEREGRKDPELAAIRPSECIAIVDDSKVIQITARTFAEDSPEPWYRVALTGE